VLAKDETTAMVMAKKRVQKDEEKALTVQVLV
jgi:hypothetical protein